MPPNFGTGKSTQPVELLLANLRKSQQESQQLIDDLLLELETTKSQLADVKKYAEAKDQEFEDMRVAMAEMEENDERAQGISRKSDILSAAAIVQKIDILNVEVFQVALSLGKMLHRTGFVEGAEERTTPIGDKARAMIGEDMVSLLVEESLKTTLDLNPLLVQVVLQVAITSWCKSNVSAWTLGNSNLSDLLAELYSKIRQIENPAFCHRWRSVTRAQLQVSSDDDSGSQNLFDGLLSVFTVAGWSTREPDQQSQLEKHFPPIFKAVLDLRKALGEDMTSMDMGVATVEPRTIFNSSSMDDAWDGRSSLTKKRASEIIRGTTGLGLQKIVMKHSDQGLTPHAEIVYRPRVVLERTVEEALSPLPPPNSLKKVAQPNELVNPARSGIHQEEEPRAGSPKKSIPRLQVGRADATTGDGADPHDKTCSLIHELDAVNLQLADARAKLEVRGKELKDEQLFLPKADTLAAIDVVQKVNALNEEVSQAAALLGEMLQNTQRTDMTQEQMTEAFVKAKWMLGEGMASDLAAESMALREAPNPLLVQVVVQIAITTWCRAVVSSWKPGDTDKADFLSAIYSEIRQFEGQAISGRWRSITRAQLRCSSDDWTENLMSGLLSILAIAGWSTREPDQQHQFERRLQPIFKAVRDMRQALGEDVMSMDMGVATMEVGEAFNPAYMEDAYGGLRLLSGSGNKGALEKVSGTTGLGLYKIMLQRGSKPRVEMVLSTKVVLEGTLKELMDPALPPSSRLKKKAEREEYRSGASSDGRGGEGAPATDGSVGVGAMLQSAGNMVARLIF